MDGAGADPTCVNLTCQARAWASSAAMNAQVNAYARSSTSAFILSNVSPT